jgi:hypothetical protein
MPPAALFGVRNAARSEFMMTEGSGPAISFCLGIRDGICALRAARLGLGLADGGALGAERSPDADAPNSDALDLRCRLVLGSPCASARPNLSFDGRKLRLDDRVLARFWRRGQQAKLLQAFELAGWPPFLIDPLGSPTDLGPEHGHRDIVGHLNKRQRALVCVHFGCLGRAVYWTIVAVSAS